MSKPSKPEMTTANPCNFAGMPRDTTPEAMAKHTELLRQAGPARRLAMAFELSDNLRQIVRDGVHHRHPDWDEARVGREVLRIVLGEKLFREVSAWGRTRK